MGGWQQQPALAATWTRKKVIARTAAHDAQRGLHISRKSVMTMRGGLATLAALGFSMLLAACGGGSGRSGTDLVVSGVGPSTQLNGGDSATFVMTVSNLGDFAASNVVVR